MDSLASRADRARGLTDSTATARDATLVVVGTAHPDAVRIASENIRVPRADFLAIWNEASRRETDLATRGIVDWYLGAVVSTCRWMAAAPMRTALCGGLPRSPVTTRACLARAELIDAEWQAAQHDDHFAPLLAARPGWCAGVRATLHWAWLSGGPPSIEDRLGR